MKKYIYIKVIKCECNDIIYIWEKRKLGKWL